MSSVNKVILVGTLGRDPEIRYLPSGEAVANISLATNSKYKNRNGEMVEETEWHRVTFFGRLAEIAGQYLKKGGSVYVEGRLKTCKYTDQSGIEKYATDIVANEMHFSTATAAVTMPLLPAAPHPPVLRPPQRQLRLQGKPRLHALLAVLMIWMMMCRFN